MNDIPERASNALNAGVGSKVAMVPPQQQKGHDSCRRKSAMRQIKEKGFTLVELLAVVAIIGILAAIVIPQVSGTRDSSLDAQTQQDATAVDSAANDFFKDQVASEAVTNETANVTADFTTVEGTPLTTVANVTQKKSTRWPEAWITAEGPESSTAVYINEFPTTNSVSKEEVTKLTVIDRDGSAITEEDLLEDYIAIDFDVLTGADLTDNRSSGYLQKKPNSVDSVSTSGSIDYHNFLWLFKKQSTAAASGEDDSRKVAVFKLLSIQETEGASTVRLTYTQIF